MQTRSSSARRSGKTGGDWCRGVRCSPPAWALSLFEALAWGPLLWGSHTINEFLGAPAAALFLLGLWNSRFDDLLGSGLKPVCNVLGRLSYPLFLLHWPLGALVFSMTGIAPGLLLWVVSGAVTLLVSGAILLLIEEPIGRLRSNIRNSEPTLPSTPISAFVD